MRNITQVQQEAIVLDAAILYADFGLATQREIGITKGGVEFNVTENVRQIEYDGRRGMTKGMEVVDEINAFLKVTTLECTNDNLYLALGGASKDANGKITNGQGGVIPAGRYLTNVTAFGIHNKTGAFKKITVFNALAAGGLTFKTTDKGEAAIDLQLNAHWNPQSVSDPVYTIEDDNVGPDVTATLRALTVVSTAGSSATSTVISVSPAPRNGAGFVYSGHSATAPAVTYDQDLASWTPIISGEEITPTTGWTKITVAEVGPDKKALGAGNTTIVYGEA